jgi:hypothetical protein
MGEVKLCPIQCVKKRPRLVADEQDQDTSCPKGAGEKKAPEERP